MVPLAALAASAADSLLWYRQPGSPNKLLEDALPLGNGRLGCLLSGGIARERIQVNEQSLWSGDNNWDGEYQCGDHGFGAYRTFGDVTILWKTGDADPAVDPRPRRAGRLPSRARPRDRHPHDHLQPRTA